MLVVSHGRGRERVDDDEICGGVMMMLMTRCVGGAIVEGSGAERNGSGDGVFQLGSSTRRWQTAYLSANTIDLGGATISSDGTGSLSIAATGATLPTGSKVVDQSIITGGKTTKTGGPHHSILTLQELKMEYYCNNFSSTMVFVI